MNKRQPKKGGGGKAAGRDILKHARLFSGDLESRRRSPRCAIKACQAKSVLLAHIKSNKTHRGWKRGSHCPSPVAWQHAGPNQPWTRRRAETTTSSFYFSSFSFFSSSLFSLGCHGAACTSQISAAFVGPCPGPMKPLTLLSQPLPSKMQNCGSGQMVGL